MGELVDFMKTHPTSRHFIVEENGISTILKLRGRTECGQVLKMCKIGLALLGYVDPVQRKGIRILALDGGGTRGVMSIEILKALEESCGMQIRDMFDLIVGTSTGAILACLLGIRGASLEECEMMYEKLSQDIFSTNKIAGTSRLFSSHAYYSSTVM